MAPRSTYRLKEPLRAVRLDEDCVGSVEELPPGTIVEVHGDAPVPGLIEVVVGDACRFALFQDDLTYRADPLS